VLYIQDQFYDHATIDNQLYVLFTFHSLSRFQLVASTNVYHAYIFPL